MMAGKVVGINYDKVSEESVILQHGNFSINYCHLSLVSVSKSQLVKAGESG